MRVLVINSFDRTGGSTVRMRRFYRFFRELGFEVAYSEANSDLDGVINIKQENTPVGFFAGAVSRLFVLLKVKYDVLFIQKLAPFTVPLIWAAKVYGKKVIVDYDDWDAMLQKNMFMKYLCSFFENISYGLPDAYIVPHLTLELLIKRKTNRKVYRIPQGLDTDLFCPSKYDKIILRKQYNLPEKAKIIGFLGVFSPAGVGEFRNIMLSAKEVISRDSSVFFLVIGGGRLLDYYRELSEANGMKNIVFTGTVSYDKVPGYISTCDVMTIWMRDEIGDFYKGTLKILEYLGMNKPVVGHLVGETKYSFSKYCIDSKPDIDSFAGNILKALGNPGKDKIDTYNFIKNNYSLNTGRELLGTILQGVKSGK